MRIPKIKYIFVVVILLRKILFPFSVLYALVVRFRNYLYDSGLKKSQVFQTKTICIGNLSVGGTGKTPMVSYLINQLKQDFKIAVLSRGYKRKTKGFLLADAQTSVENIGDEPYQLYRNFPEITVAVDADRCRGITILEDTIEPDLILLDDAFQHRKVKAGFNILLTTYGKLYCDDWYLPTGNLRDSKREAKRADIIIVTKCPNKLRAVEQDEIRSKLRPAVNQTLLFSTYSYSKQLKGKSSELSLMDLIGQRVSLVTGIADPDNLIQHLGGVGLDFEHLSYPDHHFFTEGELASLNHKKLVLTTEKDYMRLKGRVKRLYYISVRHEFLGKDDAVLTIALDTFMKQGV